MTPKRKPPEQQFVRLDWRDLFKILGPMIFAIATTATGLYVKVEISSAITAARLAALEKAIERMPSGEQLEAFRAVSNSRMDDIESRLERIERRAGR